MNKEILNKGILLGCFLILFPLVFLFKGNDFGLIFYCSVYFIQFCGYTLLLIIFSKQFSKSTNSFSFKECFSFIFQISMVAVLCLTFAKFLIWNLSFTDKYIQSRENIERKILSLQEQTLINSYEKGNLSDDLYNKQSDNFIKIKSEVEKKWEMNKETGLEFSFFFKFLITNLFLISLYCLLLSIFLKKKVEFIE